MTLTRRTLVAAGLAAPAILSLGSRARAATTLKISHQFPGGTIDEGDFRDRACRKFAAALADLDRPVHTWITSRTVHVHGIGALLGVDGAASTAAGALDGLRGVLRDPGHGGWFGGVGPGGEPDEAKSCYAHAFVMLAGSTAVVAGLPGADDVLAEATQVFEEHFWDDDLGRVVDEWDRAWTTPVPYRGLNSTMHSLEAMLAVGDVTGDDVWHRRAARLAGLFCLREGKEAR